jgi:hypothetical protein
VPPPTVEVGPERPADGDPTTAVHGSAAGRDRGATPEPARDRGRSAPGYLVRELGPGYFVGMTQPLRGLIPLLLDPEAAELMVAGVRLQEESSSPNPRCAQVVSIPFQAAIWSAGLDDYTSD